MVCKVSLPLKVDDFVAKLTVITATYNSMAYLPELAESLRRQTFREFDWIVADGGSDDGTLEYLDGILDIEISVILGPDFGIYDAINKAIKSMVGDYYLVIGSDDKLMPNAIGSYVGLLKDQPDIVTAKVKYKNLIHEPKKRMFSCLDDAWSYVSCHSVGCVFSKGLHEKFGYYSKRFPIAADQHFIKKAVGGGARVVIADFVAGEFGSSGVSSLDVLGHITETFRIQYETEERKFFQFLLFVIRLFKNKVFGKF